MPSQDFIDVSVFVDSIQRLQEYPGPNADQRDEDQSMTRYVEVKAGQQPRLKITLRPGFDFQSAQFVSVSVSVDQTKFDHFLPFKLRRTNVVGGKVISPAAVNFGAISLKDKDTGIWYSNTLEFGALGFNENGSLPHDISVDDVALLGSLQVEVVRSKRISLDAPIVHPGTGLRTIEELPEKALKGKAIENTVKLASWRTPCQEPTPDIFRYEPVKGDRGKAYKFKFLYRTKATLQHLGCIPRSPSPPPDPALMLQRTEEMLRITKQEVQARDLRILELEEKLALAELNGRSSSAIDLERNASNARMEALPEHENHVGHHTVETRIKQERGARNPSSAAGSTMKRKGDDVGEEEDVSSGNVTKRIRLESVQAMGQNPGVGLVKNEDDEDLVEVAPPPGKPMPIIDLTDE